MRKLVLGFAAAALAAAPASAALKVGEKAPDFTTTGAVGGKEFKLHLAEQLKKGPMVLYFFPKAFTSGCTAEAHAFSASIADFKKAGAQVVGMSADDLKTLHDETAFKIAVSKHITDIADKYIIPGETSDSAIMFVPAESITDKGWHAVQRLNVKGTLTMCETAHRLAMKPANRGTIVNVTVSPHHGFPAMAHTGAARAAVEALTNELEEKAIQFLTRIDSMGGMLEAIASGYPQREIDEATYRYQKEIEDHKRIIVGASWLRGGSRTTSPSPRSRWGGSPPSRCASIRPSSGRGRRPRSRSSGWARCRSTDGSSRCSPRQFAGRSQARS